MGVGQDEVDIARTADVSIVVLVPGTGDDVQALKAGIMEIADIFVVNKADREGAERLVQAIVSTLTLQPGEATDWRPPVLKTVATTGEGIADVWATVAKFRARETAGPNRRRIRHEHHLRELLGRHFLQHLERTLPAGEVDRTVDRIASREIDPYSAASDLLSRALGARP